MDVVDDIVEFSRREGLLIREWTHEGVECAMARSPMHGCNGYVRLPAGLAIDVDELGGITWGPDAARWIGFDTSHGWDAWLDPDVPESRLDRTLRELGEREGIEWPLPPLPDPRWMNIWTLEKLEAAVNELAALVAVKV